MVTRVQHRVLERHFPGDRVNDVLAPGARAGDLVALPLVAELPARLPQSVNQLLELRIVDVPCTVRAELGHEQARGWFPVGEQVAPAWVHEVQPDMVALSPGNAVEVTQQTA